MGITVVGLGPGDGRFLTREAWDVLASRDELYVRTSRHPAVADLPVGRRVHSFDAIYERADAFENVYDEIVGTLIALGGDSDIIYAVPGHPFVGESTVERLLPAAKAAHIPVRVVEGLSFVEPTLTAVRCDALSGLQLHDAIAVAQCHYPPLTADKPVLLGQVYSRMLASELKMVLTAVYPETHQVTLVHSAGSAEERTELLHLYEIDRSPYIAHLTSLFIPPLAGVASLVGLAETVAHLRSPDGCPWDQEQTPKSLRSGFLEEVAEVLDALDQDDDDGLREELGDLFYHIVMQVQMAAEEEIFTLSDVLAGIDAKLKYRHPHVWGDWQVADSEQVVRNWELLKQAEKGSRRQSLLDSVPEALPALAQSQKIQNKVRQVGFDWDDIDGVYLKVDEELLELKTANSLSEQVSELGDLFFVLVNIAHWLGIDAESALREANLKFGRRFRALEQLVAVRSLNMPDMSLEALEDMWQEVKKAEG